MDAGKASVILLVVSLAITLLLWWIGLPFFFLVLFIPLLPFLGRKKEMRRCPACGWETPGSERFCPYDATPLDTPGGRIPERDR
jgi:hypothetical protein